MKGLQAASNAGGFFRQRPQTSCSVAYRGKAQRVQAQKFSGSSAAQAEHKPGFVPCVVPWIIPWVVAALQSKQAGG